MTPFWHESDIDPAMVDVGHRGWNGHPVAVPPRRPLTLSRPHTRKTILSVGALL